MDHAVHLLPVA